MSLLSCPGSSARKALQRPGARGLAAGAAAALILGVPAPPALAVDVTVSGFVREPGDAPVVNADLDWYNRDLDLEIDPVGDHTDATGFFSVVIPEGKYEITVIGPPGNTHASEFLRDIDLQTSQTLPDVTLKPGALVTATMQTEGGTPLLGMRVSVEDVSTGDMPFLANDRSDSTGFFSDVVPFGAYDVLVEDTGPVYVSRLVEDVVVAGPVALGVLVFKPGVAVTGSVVDDMGHKIFNVDLDVLDQATGEQIVTLNDNTDLFGNYSLLIPTGTFTFRFTPAPGSPFADEEVTGMVVAGAGSVGSTTLRDGLAVSGLVTDAGGLLEGVDIDVIDVATGQKRYVNGDFTDAGGAYSFLLPTGTYDLTFDPPPGMPLASFPLWNVAVAGPTALPGVLLVPGVLISGTVTGNAAPVPGVDLDFIIPASGKTYPTPGDDTDVSGNYAVRVAPGTYRVTADPPPVSGFGMGTLENQVVSGSSTMINIVLGAVTAVGDNSVPFAQLLTAYPNPFTRALQIQLNTPETDPAVDRGRVRILDAGGRLVRTLPGSSTGTVLWDGAAESGNPVSRGVYYLRAERGSWSATTRVVKLR